MDAHENARTTPHSRMLIVERLASGWSVATVATAQGVDPRTVRKWRDRFAAEGASGLADRSSRPHRSPTRLDGPPPAEIEALRRQRLTGPYEREHPGELIHLDIKKLGRIDGIGHRFSGHHTGMVRNRGIGWEYLHVAIDDASRLAFTALMPDERKESAIAFLNASLAWFASHGVTVQRVMTDNGSAYRSRDFAGAIAAHAIRHKRTRPYTPRTNGKAERFIQTSIREWAYATPFASSAERERAMHPWLHDYNTARPHSALKGKPPLSRLPKDNVLGSDS